MTLHSRATSMGMRRWWARQPICPVCKETKLGNPRARPLCAKCRRLSDKIKEHWVGVGKATIILDAGFITLHRSTFGKWVQRVLSGTLEWPYTPDGEKFGFHYSREPESTTTLYLAREDFEILPEDDDASKSSD